MTFTIEPMLTLGTHEWDMWDDGWTVVTKDRRRTRAVRAHPARHRRRRRDPHPALTRSAAWTAIRHRRLRGMATRGFGIDIGGTGIKGAPGRPATPASFAAERRRIADPAPSTPDAVADVRGRDRRALRRGSRHGPVGVTVPRGDPARRRPHRRQRRPDAGSAPTSQTLLATRWAAPVRVVNDADAAGVAEARYGAGRATRAALVFMATLGTGIGSALLVDGVLVPNTELGPPGDRRQGRRDPRRRQRPRGARA